MRIIYLSQYFPPEVGATQNRAYEMASNLVRLGHSVTMLTEIPNHPSGVIPPEYKRKLIERSPLSGIDVIRVWVYTSQKKTFSSRLLFYISYMLNAILAGIFLVKGPYDLIYASSPPLFVGGAALALSFIKNIPFIFEVRDLWPETAIELGELSNRTAIAWSNRLELACYTRARKIIVVTKGIRNRLIERQIDTSKIAVIPNGSNSDLFRFDPVGRERVRQQLNLINKFVVIYAGIHGIAQGLDSVIEAARMMQHRDDIHFLFVGEGPQKSQLQALASGSNLPNIHFIPEQLREVIPAYLSASDVALVPLRKLNLFKSALPSKIFDAWACERPVLSTVDGEAKQIVDEARGGLTIPPEDPEKLAAALDTLKSSPDLRQSFGENGRLFTLKYYSRRAQAEQLSRILEDQLKAI